MPTIAGQIYLGPLGTETLLPAGARKLTPIYQEIVKTNRTANGTLREDVVRKYTDYQIDYEVMIGSDHEIIEGLYNLNTHLNLIIVDRSNVSTAQMVKMTWTPGVRESIAGGWEWDGVSISLEAV